MNHIHSSTNSSRGDLTIAGTGIGLVGQMTLDAMDQIKRADRVLYVANDPAAANWLHHLNPASQTLMDCYAEGRPRSDTYREMTDRILGLVRAGYRVVAVFYGHPGFGVDPAHAALKQAASEGYPARMLPGVSAEACLIADLGIDPVRSGWQGYEASRFLVNRPRFDPRSPLVLWQLGFVYINSVDFAGRSNPHGVRDVSRALRDTYPPSHPVVLYEASPFPVCKPRIERIPLSRLARATIRSTTTLFVSPQTSVPRVRRLRRAMPPGQVDSDSVLCGQ